MEKIVTKHTEYFVSFEELKKHLKTNLDIVNVVIAENEKKQPGVIFTTVEPITPIKEKQNAR